MNSQDLDKIKNKRKFNEIIFYLLRDFQMQTTLSEKIYPKYHKAKSSRKIHPTIEYWFSDFIKKSCEFKNNACMSKPLLRKGESKPYQTKKPGYRLEIKKFIENFTKFKFSDRTKFILECLFYPSSIRNLVFTKERSDFFEGNPEKVFGQWIISFLTEYFYPQILYTKDITKTRDKMNSKHNFDKYISKSNPEEVSRFTYLISNNPELYYASYISQFIDEEFILDICKGFPDKNQKLFVLKMVKEKIEGQLGWKYLSKNKIEQAIRNKPTKKIKYRPGIIGVNIESLYDKNTLMKNNEEIKILENIYNKLEKEYDLLNKEINEKNCYFVTEKDFIPNEVPATGDYGREKKMKIINKFKNL